MSCRGTCCASFPFPFTPAELYARWRNWPSTSEGCRDDLYIADMLIPLGNAAPSRVETFNADSDIRLDLIRVAEGGRPLYTCRHWDEETRLCGAYEDRPKMCRDYPYRGSCEHGCGFRPEPHVAVEYAGYDVANYNPPKALVAA